MSKPAIDDVYGAQPDPILYEAHPALFRNHPFWFLFCLILVPLGIGAIILGWWYLTAISTTLTVTERRVRLRTGLLSKSTSDVFIGDIRNVRLSQTFFQRLMDTGYIGISSAGQSGVEIEINGIPRPNEVKDIIDRYR